MNDAFDHLLEFLLREVMAGPSTASLPVRGTRSGPHWRRRAWPWLAVAATAATVMVITLADRERQAAAIAAQALLVAGGDGVMRPETTLAVAAPAWCRAGPPVRVTLPGGAAADVFAGTAVVHRGDALELVGGEILTATASRAWRIRTELGDVEVAPDSVVAVRLSPSLRLRPEEPDMRWNDVISRIDRTTVALSITVLLGAVDLVTAQERTNLRAGGRTAVQDAASARRDAAAASALFVACNRELPEPTDEKAMLEWKQVDEQFGDLTRLWLRSPAAVGAVRADLQRALARPESSDTLRGRMIRLALLSEDAGLLRAAAEAARQHPDACQLDDWMALAERGEQFARAPLHEFLKDPAGTLGAQVNAALVVGGEQARRDDLAPFLTVSMRDAFDEFMKFDARCIAAVAFAHLGDPVPRRLLLAELAEVVASRLETPQDVVVSADLVRRATYFFGQPTPRLGHLGTRLMTFEVPALRGEPDADAVRAAVANLQAIASPVSANERR